MPIVDTTSLKSHRTTARLARPVFYTATMTFAHYDFERDATIHEHFHPAEEVYEVLEGELEITRGSNAFQRHTSQRTNSGP